MIFAIIDYIKYKLQKGIYSLESIHKRGAVLAEPSLLPQLEKYKPLDILFVHTANSIMSWAVMYYTGPTIWSHCATFGKDGYLYDCTTQGLIEHHISDYFDGKSYITVKAMPTNTPEKAKKKGLLYAEKILGVGFDWEGIFFFWLRIITGNHKNFRVSCVADIVILLIVLMAIFYKILILRYVFLALCLFYLLVVVFSRIRMIMFKTKKGSVEDSVGEKTENKYVVGKNIIDDLIELSLDDLEKYFEPFEKDFAKSPELVITAYNNMASKLAKIDEFEKAEMLYKKALRLCEDSTPEDKTNSARILNNLAGVYVEKKQYNKAIELMDKAKKLLTNIPTEEAKALYDSMNNNTSILNKKIAGEY